MKFIKPSLMISLFVVITSAGLKAQQAPVAAGGKATGQNGSISYSIGQIDYITNTGTGGTITQGIQQPYEIFIVGIADNPNINLEVSAFPNPTSYRVNLKVENLQTEDMSYRLYDQNGSLLLKRELDGDITIIPMQDQPSGAYLLKVSDKKNEIKSFKIIKK